MIRCLLSALLICSAAAFAQVQSPIVVTNTAQLAAFNVGTVKAAILVSTNGNVEFAYDKNATTATNTSATDPIIESVSGGRWFGKKIGSGVGGSGDVVAANNLSEFTATGPQARANLGAETKSTFNVLDYITGSAGTNAANDTLGIRAAITAAGTNRTLTFPSGSTFLTAGSLEPLAGQTWIMHGAKIKRANETTVNFSTAITTSGAQTITVSSTNGFFVGMDVSVFNGSSFDVSSHRITAMTATTITMGTAFTTAFPSGGTLVTAFPQIRAVNVPRVRIYGGEFDGNRANNTSLQKWELNVEVYLASDGGMIREAYIHDAQSEGIEAAGVNILIEHNRIEDCQGNGIHLFATEHPIIRGNKIKNVNLSGTATGHADGCVIASNVVGDWIVEDNWLENGIGGVASFDSTDNSRLLVHGNTFTNLTTYAIEGAMPVGANVSEAIITDNKFFNSAIVTFNEVSGDATDTNGVKNVTFNNNQLTDTKAVFVLTRGVIFSGNTITNSTTNAVNVSITDCRDFSAANNNITGGGFGFYVSSSANGTNCVNISIRNNILRNQWTTAIDLFTAGMINSSAIGNTIIARTNFVSPSAWVGMIVSDGSVASQNQIYAEDGLYGIQMGSGATGSSWALDNKVITRSGMPTIKMFGGSVNAYVDQNYVSSAVVDSGVNFVGNNVVIGNSLSGGSGVTGTGKTVLSLQPSITNLLAWNRIGFIDSGSTNDTNHYVSASAGSLFINTIGSLKVNTGNGILQLQNTPVNDGNISLRLFDTVNSKTVDINSLNGYINLRPASGAGVRFQDSTGTTNLLTSDDSGNVSILGSMTTGSSGGAGGVAWSDGGSHWFRISPPTMTTDINWIPPTAPISGLVKMTISSTTNDTFSAAVSGTDYAPATSGSAILKGNGSGGFSNAASGTDYAPATSGSSILKGNGSGGFSNAASGTDYAPATSGSAILKGNGSGGFSNATANTDYAPVADPIFTGSLQLPNGAAPTTDAFGEIAGDNNAWAASRGAVQFYDGTANTYLVGVLASDTPSNGQVPTWNAGGTITWETPSAGGGGTSVYVNGASVTNPNFIGGQFDVNTSTNIVIKSAAAITNVVNSGKVTLTDAATIATDASLGNSFQVTLGGNRTLGNPTNGKNGQKCIWELIQDGTGSRTITMDTKFAFGTDITGITLTTTASKRDFITAQYDSTADKWYVVGFVRGY